MVREASPETHGPSAGSPYTNGTSHSDVLSSPGTRFVRFSWLDLANTSRCRVVPVAQYAKLAQKSNAGVIMTRLAPALALNSVPDGFPPVGDVTLVPDASTAVALPYAPGHVDVLGLFMEEDGSGDMRPSGLCPRGLLKRVVE
jgi:glutamine synthetase